MSDYRDDAPEILRDFLSYHETIRGHSKKTADEYFLDLRMFFRFLKLQKNLAPRDADFDSIAISDVGLPLIASVTLTDVYEFLTFLSRARPTRPNSPNTDYGLGAKARARKISAIRSFYKYLTVKTKLLDENPVLDLDSPKIPRTLPRYLSLDDSRKLLESVQGQNRERDYCILTLFLNCGLRISELIGLNLNDIAPDSLRVLGKGNKERVVFLNEACVAAINGYLEVRKLSRPKDARALFISRNGGRVGRTTVHDLVKKHLLDAGLERKGYSAHKLRHTAATLLLQNGVDVRTLQELLGHENLNTTQIYTHVEKDSLREAALRSPLAGEKSGDKDK
ncbi:MAG: tyrosine recombinase XerC [Oscillospiraceae bacterium]|nr:tyrosine recombinase XerC [Oscillospiraceae bacterium]